MGKHSIGPRGILCAGAAIALAGIVAACAGDPTGPAPVIMKGAAIAGEGASALSPSGEARQVTVRPGQSLGGIAHAYHVPAREIIAANHLKPPYKIEIGAHLLIPGSGLPPVQQAMAPPGPPAPPPSTAPAMPPVRQAMASASAGRAPPEMIPLDGPAPAPPTTRSAMPPAGIVVPPGAASSAVTLSPPASSAPASSAPAGHEPSVADEARAEPATAALPHGAHFSWPVRGHVLAGYGTAPGGSHNDGINIAAPRGTLVAAVDAGVVAYAGNEVPGYGNLVLVKHASGWITAYAHCDDILVKRGDKVGRGQIIARVGDTGGVSEPQLHFELRRGKRPVDPREFLTPAPSANGGAQPAG